MLGIREDGTKEVLDYALNPTENKTTYKELFLSLRERGVEETATLNLGQFLNTWSYLYPKLKGLLSDTTNLFTFYKFPKEIRSTIYTTNLIENLHKHFKRYTKRKEQFPNEESLDRFAYAFFSEYNAIYSERSHRGFKSSAAELSQLC